MHSTGFVITGSSCFVLSFQTSILYCFFFGGIDCNCLVCLPKPPARLVMAGLAPQCNSHRWCQAWYRHSSCCFISGFRSSFRTCGEATFSGPSVPFSSDLWLCLASEDAAEEKRHLFTLLCLLPPYWGKLSSPGLSKLIFAIFSISFNVFQECHMEITYLGFPLDSGCGRSQSRINLMSLYFSVSLPAPSSGLIMFLNSKKIQPLSRDPFQGSPLDSSDLGSLGSKVALVVLLWVLKNCSVPL